MPQPVASASSIVLDEAGGRLYVTSPDDEAVVVVSPDDGAELDRWPVPGSPEMLAWRDATHLVVTLNQRGAVAELDVVTGAVVERPVPCGSARAVVVMGERVIVSCPDDDRIVELDGTWRSIPGAPSGLAAFGDRLGVALARGGALAVLDLSGETLASAPMTTETVRLPEGVAASSAAVVAADPVGGFALSYQRVEHDADRDRDPARGGYGSVIDGTPRIEPRLLSVCGARYARFDGGALAMSGPSALASGGGLTWITHLATDGVVVARCSPVAEGRSDGALDVLTTYAVGRAPRGIALSADGRTAFVDNGFDWSVSRLDAPDAAVTRLAPTWTRTRTRGPTSLSEPALRGRRLFFDAVDTHLTPSGVVSCGTCHPRAGDDGLRWFLHTEGIARKVRRTPPAWGARAELSPFHWDGELADAVALSRSTTEELMEGDGLLIDFPAMAAYLAEVPLPTPRAPLDTAAVPRGRTVFESSGCDDCHAGPLLADGERHAVLPPSDDADANVMAASTPPLVGVRARSPFFHDGRAATLADTLAVPGDTHGVTSPLSESERNDLIAYLESL